MKPLNWDTTSEVVNICRIIQFSSDHSEKMNENKHLKSSFNLVKEKSEKLQRNNQVNEFCYFSKFSLNMNLRKRAKLLKIFLQAFDQSCLHDQL